MTCPSCKGEGNACLQCEGTGEVCDVCGESVEPGLSVCEPCEAEEGGEA